MRSLFLLLWAGVALADDVPPVSVPIEAPPRLVAEEKPAVPKGAALIPDVTKWRCIPSRLYADDCGHALARHATRHQRAKQEADAVRVLRSLSDG